MVLHANADRGVLAAVMRFAAAGGAIAGGAIAEVTSLQVVIFFGAASFIAALVALIPMREPPRTSTAGGAIVWADIH